MSAPWSSVTGVQVPLKAPHEVLPDSGAESRSTTPLDESTPAPSSDPSTRVRSTESAEYHGPPERATVCPVGAVVSGVRVKVPLLVVPALLVAVTVLLPVAVLVLSQL